MSGESGARILVVDDVPENARLLEAVRAPRGYEVVPATDGVTALELAESAQPDLVLLDVMMPPPDGYAVCRRLREREETAMLPVIMLTASDGPEKLEAIEAGADDFIAKPLNHDEHMWRDRLRRPLRLCGNRSRDEPRVAARGRGERGQVLIAQRLYAEVEAEVEAEPVGELRLKGFKPPVAAFDVVGVREPAAEVSRF
jgi:CheY-like chemotaxis protein